MAWMWERWRAGGLPPWPDMPFPRMRPEPCRPRASIGEITVTWVGHATTLIQIGGLNVLTDPIFSRRASPVSWAGPVRIEPPGIAFDDLPPIDVVLLSHDHYDHLDRPTVDALVERHGSDLTWLAPLGHEGWLRGRGAGRIEERDWHQRVRVDTVEGRTVDAICLPAQHWTRRALGGTNRRLWASWALEDPGGRRIYFAGDSGYCPAFREIGERWGPFDAALIPIGAYEPRWFMESAHMNPEESVQTYRDLGGSGTFVGIHWGTFQLTDEPPAEPPERVRAAWEAEELPEQDLWIPAFGETRKIPER